MIDINWKKFEVKNPKATEAFENMCYFLFCRKYGIKEGIRTDFNQVGLETEPIKVKGKYYGFQSKFFGKNINYSNIENSIAKALKHYDNLDYIIIYLNQEAQTSCDTALSIETKCKEKGITVEWYLPNNFKLALNQPSNLDLAQFYFGESDILGFISEGKNLRMSTLLQSKEYIELFLYDTEKNSSITEYANQVLQAEAKLHLLSGAAGTGKSVCMSRLLHIYGGLEEETQEKQHEKLQLIGAIPIYINLNNTSIHSLNDIIKHYKKDFHIIEQSSRFIYLFDGLDEIPRDKLNSTLLFIEELLRKESTKKIVISTRLSSYNKYILKSIFRNLDEYIIAGLNDDQICQYFRNKENKEKSKKLSVLINENPKFVDNVQDVLTLSLLWNHIEKISKSSSLTSLMQYSVLEILRNIHHRKNLELLNLPKPKEDSIMELNKKIAFSLFERDILSVEYAELYDIIGRLFPKCDYNSSNEIIEYLSECFFDVTTTNESYSFAYQHKRFSEYFTILELGNQINEDLNYLRTHNIIINTDLFDEMLIPYLKDKAMEEKDLPLAFLVGLFNVYLGNDRAWGVEKSFYYWSDWIVLAMASQNNEIFESIIHDQSLPYHEFFNHIPKRIMKHLSNKSIKPSSNDELRQFFKVYVSLIVYMDKFDKQSYLPSLLKSYDEIIQLVRENDYYYSSSSNRDSNAVWRNINYINTKMNKDGIDARVDTAIAKFEETNIDNLFGEYIRTEILYLSSLYYNLILHHIDKCPSVVKRMNLNQLSVFIIAMAKPECIKKAFENDMLFTSLKELCESEVTSGNLSGVMIIALKITLGLEPLKKEIELVQDFFDKNKLRDSSIFWKDHCDTVGFMLNAFVDIGKDNIEPSIIKYGQAYSTFIKMISKSCSISKFVRVIKPNLFNKNEGDYYNRILLGKALALADEDDIYLKGTIDYVNRMFYDGGILVSYYNMKLYNSDRFDKLLSVSDLIKLCSESIYRDIDFTSTSDSLFMLSFIMSKHDDTRSYDLLLKGISNGILRMNDRKDTIGDYRLIESLRVLLEHNWISTDKLKGYLTRILKITEVMDSHHIDNDSHRMVMKLLCKYDFNAAQYYYEKIALLNATYNQIHLEYAIAMIHRGVEIDEVERCLGNITTEYDRYHQKISCDSFYCKIKAYLTIANTDFYLEYEQKESFTKARDEIQSLSGEGWERELEREGYEVYVQLCDKYKKDVDVQKRKEYEYTTSKEEKAKVDVLDKLKIIEEKEFLDEFFKKIESNYLLDNFEVNDLLIQKCLYIYGNIEAILELFTKLHYPSSTQHTYNSQNFWMTVVSALRNQQSKNIMIDYLIKSGGGHDGFSELIKIYGYLDNKEVCTNAFDTMLNSIELLLC